MNFIGPLLAFVLGVAVIPAAEAATAVGSVSRAFGPSEGTVEGTTRTLAIGLPVHLDEVVTTGEGARLEITFDDGTTLTVSEKASLTIDEFVYAPAGESVLEATIAGAFRLATAALAPGETRRCNVTTPFGAIGVRGTDFWGGPLDDAFAVFLIEGAVLVSNAGGETLLSAPGEGVTVPGIDAPPGPATVWAQERVDRALAAVTFP